MKRKPKVVGNFGGESLRFASLLKLLASTDEKTRNRALRVMLETWLPSQSQLSDGDMKKLWKSLFYCFWHSDKPPVQARLADRLSSMITELQAPLSLQFFSVFLLTIRREWGGIDFLRLDKFYLLIRRFLHGVFALLKKNHWDSELVESVIRVIMDRTFLDTKNLKGNGVNYHVATVFLEEFKFFLPLRKEVLEKIIVPFVGVTGKVSDKILLGKLKNSFFDELLTEGGKLLDANRTKVENPGASLIGPIGAALCLADKFYEVGASEECVKGNRKTVFELHESFSKLSKDLEASGVDISLPENATNEDIEDVPLLVPIENVPINEKKGSASKEKKGSKRKPKTEETVTFTESVILNLQMQFDKVAEEEDKGSFLSGTEDLTKKRKRAKSTPIKESSSLDSIEIKLDESACKTEERSAKKVRFSMKNNLVWKPHNPLPPQNLRIPPSVTPRGSALKKGVPPGPIIEVPSALKLKRRPKYVKKTRNGILSVTPIKRVKKLRPPSSI